MSDIREILYDSSRECIEKASEMLLNDEDLIRDCIQISLEGKSPFANRCSRTLHHSAELNKEMMGRFAPEIIEILDELKNESVIGNLLKFFVIIDLPHNEDLLGKLTVYCFDLLNLKMERRSAKVYAMEILYKICIIEPDLKIELISVLESRYDQENPSFRSRAGKIIKRLHK